MVPRALPWARDLLPFQGARGEGCGDSIVAHFARKVRGAKVGAQHELKIQQSHAPERWSCSLRVRGPHFASKVSYSASPQSLAAKKFVNSFNSLLRRLRPPIKFVVMLRPNKFRCIPRPPASAHKKKVSRSGHPFQFFLHHYFKTALACRGDVDARLLWQLFCRETLSRQVI